MRLSISNIAWDAAEDPAVAALLASHRIDAIDVAPGKYFPDPLTATALEIARVRDWWCAHGIAVIGMQALLFGSSGLNLFGPPAVRARMLTRLAAVCRIGAALGATRLTFGSPRNRDRSGLDDAAVAALALPFFAELGRIAAEHGVVVCLEPNPARYGTNYLTDIAGTAAVVTALDHPAIRLQLDAGALTIDGEDPAQVVPRYAHLVGHVHASEPDLVPFGTGGTDHAAVAAQLRRALPTHPVTVEMLRPTDAAPLATLDRALAEAVRCYRDVPGEARR